MSLAHYYGVLYGRKGKRPENITNEIDLFNYFGKESPLEERIAVFMEVIKNLETDFGTWNIPWGEINRYQRLNGDILQPFDDSKPSIPVGFASGRWGALAAYGKRYTNNTKKIYGTRGNSFIAAVEFGDKVKAKTLLAGEAQPYANAKFKEALYYKIDVLKHAQRTYKPGE